MIATRRRIVTVLGLAVSVRAHGQAIRHLTPTQDLRIGAQALGAARDVLIALAPDGRVIVAPRFGGLWIVAFDSLGNRLPWKIAVGRRDDSEILVPSRIGFIAGTATMWVADNGYQQVALVDADGKVFKSLESPSWVHPTWAERRKYPVFANSQAFALYKDESMLLLPGRERALLETPGYDRSGLHLLRTSSSGSIQRTVAMVPSLQDRLELHAKRCEHVIPIPFGTPATWAVSADGSRLVVVKSGVSAADSGTVRVTTLDDHGDTVFSRIVPQPAVRIPQATIDNFLSMHRGCGDFSTEEIRDSLTRRLAAFKSFVVGVLPGRDQTTWVTMRPEADTATERTAIGLDERGGIIGVATLPPNQLLVGADRNHLWMIEGGRMRAPVALVRYKLDATPVQPPRSGRAGAPSSPAPIRK